MLFKFKKKTITLDCYCSQPQIEEILPPRLAKQSIPSWFKSQPADIGPMPTTKICPGIKEYYKKGVVFNLWCDYKFTWTKDNVEVQTPLRDYHSAETHESAQWNYQYPGWIHVKVLNPWFIDTKEMIPFMMLEPFWFKSNQSPYKLAPGILEFKYQHALHGQVFLPPTQDKEEMFLNAGDPFLHLVPLEDVNLKINICEMDRKSWDRIVHKSHFAFDRIYHKTKKFKQQLENDK